MDQKDSLREPQVAVARDPDSGLSEEVDRRIFHRIAGVVHTGKQWHKGAPSWQHDG